MCRMKVVLAAVVATSMLVGCAAPDAVEVSGSMTDAYRVWERNDDGRPVRWDPCSNIEVVFNPAGAPAGARDDVAAAVAIVADATGLTIEVTDDTDEVPAGNRLPYQPERYGERWAPVLVAWAPPEHNGLTLQPTDRGLALPVSVGDEGARTYVSGQVVLNADRSDLVAGFGDRSSAWGAVLLHELGHIVGLAHGDDPADLMYGGVVDGPVELGAGDVAGLAAVGDQAGGCVDVPDAGPVEVSRGARVERG